MAIALIHAMSFNNDERKFRPAVLDESFLRNRGSSLSLTNRIPFPMKLFQILENVEREGYEWIVSWSADGKSFRVHNSTAFVQRLMPQYFRQTRYKSFQRQLHLYGFSRLTSGYEKGGYRHPQFMKNSRNLCQDMIPLKKTQKLFAGNKARGEESPSYVTDASKDGGSPWESQIKLPPMPDVPTNVQFLPPQTYMSTNHDTIVSGILDAPEKPLFAMQQGTSSVYPFGPIQQNLSMPEYPGTAVRLSSGAQFCGNKLDAHGPCTQATTLAWDAILSSVLLSNHASSHGASLQFLQGQGSNAAIQPLFQARADMMAAADQRDDAFNSPRTSLVGKAMIQQYHDPFKSGRSRLPTQEPTKALPVPSFPDNQSSPQTSESFAVPTQGSEEDACANVLPSTSFEGRLTHLVERLSLPDLMPSDATMAGTHGLPEDFDFSILEPRPFKTLGDR